MFIEDESLNSCSQSGATTNPYCTAAVTFIRPRPVMPRALAAASDRSITRPLVNGPRSFTVTTTLRLDFGTRGLGPKLQSGPSCVTFYLYAIQTSRLRNRLWRSPEMTETAAA